MIREGHQEHQENFVTFVPFVDQQLYGGEKEP